jgi:WD40 repeat protein
MKIIIWIFLLIGLGLHSQPGPNSNWYFGANAGITFNSGSPVALTNGALATTEGVAAISDNSGNLLFYTNGITVWNRNHVIMTNGTMLLGNQSSTQSAIIVPIPGSTSRYFIFTSDADATVGTGNGIRYSEVDMTLSGGLGAITLNKNILLHAPSCEKLVAVLDCNNIDVWVISHDWNSNGFRCWKVTAGGITTFAWSLAGVIVSGISQGSYGQLKASPDGTKLLACYYGFAGNGLNRVELYDFNTVTGAVTNAMNISTEVGVYGCEFSPNGDVIYAATNGGMLIQWNISSGVLGTIQASRTVISNAGPFMGSLQLGPDNKIYVARNNTSLSVINNPNIPGIGCGYSNLSISLAGRNSRMGLPNFPHIYQTTTVGPIEHN